MREDYPYLPKSLTEAKLCRTMTHMDHLTVAKAARIAVAMAALLGAMPAGAEMATGRVQVIDGDTLEMTGLRIRLFGIDAPELDQTCKRGAEVWSCGKDARSLLATLIDDREVRCDRMSTDVYGRMVAVCQAGGLDIARSLVDAGLAVALPNFSEAYVEPEARAQARKAGIWAATFVRPEEYRAAQGGYSNARSNAPALPRVTTVRPRVGSAPVHYRGCNEVRAAGKAPLYRGQPGYRPEMDGDGDGIACESRPGQG